MILTLLRLPWRCCVTPGIVGERCSSGCAILTCQLRGRSRNISTWSISTPISTSYLLWWLSSAIEPGSQDQQILLRIKPRLLLQPQKQLGQRMLEGFSKFPSICSTTGLGHSTSRTTRSVGLKRREPSWRGSGHYITLHIEYVSVGLVESACTGVPYACPGCSHCFVMP